MNKLLLGMLLSTYLVTEAGQYGRPYFISEEQSLEEQIREEIREGEKEELAILVQAEAGNQSLEGKRYVVDVVLNRVADPAFPDSIHEVIFQEGQFSVINDGAYDKACWTVTEECFEAVRLEMEMGEQLDYDVLYFSRGKSSYGTNWFKIGDHWFGSKKSE